MTEPAPKFTEEDRERLQTWINGWTRIRADADAASLARALAYIEQLESALAADGPAPTTLKGEDDDEAG